MGNKIIIAILASLAFVSTAFAQDEGEKKSFNITGDFAGSIQFHDNESSNTIGPNRHDEFNVNLVEINLEKNWSASSLNISIGYGSTANLVNPIVNPATPTQTLNLTNAFYKMNSSYGVSFMFGKWEAPFGIEHYNHRENAQFTRSYGFSLTPYFQTGAGVNYNGGMWDAGLIVSNGSGFEQDANDNNKTMALTVGVNPMENLAFDVNYITGSEADNTAANVLTQINTLDVSVAYMINEMFDVALNYVSRGQKATTAGATDENATSIAAYVNANLGMFGLGLRYENFAYDDGSSFGGLMFAGNPGTAGKPDNTISSITLAAKAEIDQNANVILEYRMDSSSEKIWAEKDTTTATDAQNTITLGLTYNF